jgi:hypothetical protein
MKTQHFITAASIVLAATSPLQAAEVTVSLTNLTGGMHFTPRLLVAHTSAVDLFDVGSAASTGLATLAEGGNTSALSGTLDASPDNNSNQEFGGLLAPATVSSDYTFETGDHPLLSMAAMLLPTNDRFVGLERWEIPTEAGTYTILLNAYDAGSEANDEIINGGGALGTAGIPAAPGADGGTGATGVTSTESNTMVHQRFPLKSETAVYKAFR